MLDHMHMVQLLALALALACLVPAPASAYGPFYPDTSGSVEFNCKYRSLAWEFAKKVQPAHDASLTFDALMLGATCNQTRPPTPPVPAAAAAPGAACSVYVAVDGDDKHSGTSPSTAKRTVGAGVQATRLLQAGPKSLCIGVGTFHLQTTLELTAADSGLAIEGAAGGGTWLSGAQLLPKLTWTQYKVAPATPPVMKILNNTDNQEGCTPDDPAAPGCGCFNQSMSAASCQKRCETLGQAGCNSFAWSGGGGEGGHWANQCCIRTDGVWNPKSGNKLDADHVCGRRDGGSPAVNVWKTTLPPAVVSTLPAAAQLRVNGVRSSRARFPNSNPETDIWPAGWVPDAKTWLAPKPPKGGPPKFIQVMNPLIASRNAAAGEDQGKNYSGGIGGPCEVFEPPFSYWCSAHPAGGGGFQFFVPGGMTVAEETFPKGKQPSSWSKGGKGATVHAFRKSHWASWMFDVDSAAADTIKFGKGGYQGCRGGNGQDWFVENVLELLDAPNEHYLDEATGTLYYQGNATTGPPAASLTVAVPALMTLLRASASQASPIKGLSLKNLGFRDAAPTFMEPHGVPSGGDWALERMGAVLLEGTEGLAIEACRFERNDGNALMLSGYHRHAAVTGCHFAWTGGTAIGAWGRTDELSDQGRQGWDATKGDLPAYTRVEGNIMRESGIWEKQSSCFFQAKAAASTVRDNLCFNLPRAGFNFNDGLGGGDEVHGNLIFNSCRETSDHGPINSWDRQPYVSTFGEGGPKPTAHMLPRNISYNFLVANYGGSNGAIDNDDQSLRYENNHNFQVYGHQKFKTGAILSYGNVIAYASEFGGKWKTPGTILDEPNAMFNNQVWFADGKQYHSTIKGEWEGARAYGNALVGADVRLPGAHGGITLAQWQAMDSAHNDVGSTYKNVSISLVSDDIIAAARKLLSL